MRNAKSFGWSAAAIAILISSATCQRSAVGDALCANLNFERLEERLLSEVRLAEFESDGSILAVYVGRSSDLATTERIAISRDESWQVLDSNFQPIGEIQSGAAVSLRIYIDDLVSHGPEIDINERTITNNSCRKVLVYNSANETEIIYFGSNNVISSFDDLFYLFIELEFL